MDFTDTFAPVRRGLARATLVALCAITPLAAWADANVTAPPVNNADFDLGADAVKAGDWPRAIYHLDIAAKAEPANADVQNLLGFAYRKSGKYDMAFMHYANALRLDPTHRGAHEYVGEAHVNMGNKPKALEHLAALDKICGKSCPEYQELAKYIATTK